jgi:spore germination protein KB
VNKQSLLLRICCLRTLPLLIGTATLFKIKSPSRLVYPLGIIVLFLSITIASNFQEHLYEGLHVARFLLHMPLFAIVPILLLIIAFLKNRKKQHR